MYPAVHAKSTPDKAAYIMVGSGEAVSYRQLDEGSNRCAHLFRSLGLRSGDGIAFCLENHPRFFEIAWAAQRSGLYYTPISSRLTAAEVEYIVKDCGAKVFLTSRYKQDVAQELREQILALVADGGVEIDHAVEAFAGPGRISHQARPRRLDDQRAPPAEAVDRELRERESEPAADDPCWAGGDIVDDVATEALYAGDLADPGVELHRLEGARRQAAAPAAQGIAGGVEAAAEAAGGGVGGKEQRGQGGAPGFIQGTRNFSRATLAAVSLALERSSMFLMSCW